MCPERGRQLLKLASLIAISGKGDTDIMDDNRKSRQLAPCPKSPNCVSTLAEDDSKRMEPLPLSGSAVESVEAIKSVVESMGRAKVIVSEGGYIHAEFRSALFRFVDDVEFLADEAAGVVHFRSASRLGWSDLGVNRRRMEDIAARYREKVGG